MTAGSILVFRTTSVFSRGTFRKKEVPYFGVLIIRILLFRVLYQAPLFSETPNDFRLCAREVVVILARRRLRSSGRLVVGD